MNNDLNMNTVAQKLINKLAVAEYNNTLLETKNEELEVENKRLKSEFKEIKNKEKAGK